MLNLKGFSGSMRKIIITVLMLLSIWLMFVSYDIGEKIWYQNMRSHIGYISTTFNGSSIGDLSILKNQKQSLDQNIVSLHSQVISLNNQVLQFEQYLGSLQTAIQLHNNEDISNNYNVIFGKIKFFQLNNILEKRVFIENTNNNINNLNQIIKSVVVNNSGVFGRVTGCNTNCHLIEVMPINDIKSRIPVFVKNANVYAIASGDGQDIYLDYMDNNATLTDNDPVFTSNENNLILSNIPFGKIKHDLDGIRIIPNADLYSDYVAILSQRS